MPNPQATLTRPAPSTRPSVKRARPWNVVLLNDDDHTYDYVIELLQGLFGHTREKAMQIAETVDKQGRAVCFTTHRELAELKCEQIHTFGADIRIASCRGAMTSIIEPADFGGDDEDGE